MKKQDAILNLNYKIKVDKTVCFDCGNKLNKCTCKEDFEKLINNINVPKI